MGFPLSKLLLIFLVFSGFSLQPSYSCLDHERSALLHFKNSFVIDCDVASYSATAYPKVKSHHGDCCSWDGVYCSNKTGHVTGLDLSSSCLYGTFPDNTTLFSLLHLRHLNLRDNHFNLSGIPSQLGQFTKLVSLNLSDSAFSGRIPLVISNLSMLSALDLSHISSPKADSQLTLEDHGLERLVQNLTLLRRLYLGFVDISSSVPNILANLTHLQEVDLTFCNLNGQFPTDIFHLPHLEVLNLQENSDLVGFLPEFQHNSPLRLLSLDETSFHGELPSSIGELANLEYLWLDGCDLTGPIPPSLGNLTKLTYLDLGGDGNAFSGDLPSSLTNLTQLKWLGLSNLNGRPDRLVSCLSNLNYLAVLKLQNINLGGVIPSSIANFTSLQVLNLSENQLSGKILHWLTNLTQLYWLDLSNNQLEGPMFSPGISQLSNLETLQLNGNRNLHGNFNDIYRFKKLIILGLRMSMQLTN